ncbi:MAG: rihA [Chloroflexi bacterium]|nr:rihA [Chloroflexota bacterium]
MHTPKRLLVVVALVAACASPATPAPSGANPTSTPAAPRAILIDTDLGVDDILAIPVLLRDPAVDVRAITVAGTGEVRCGAGTRNLRLLLAAFGALDIPVGCGRQATGQNGREFPFAWRDGADAFYGMDMPPLGVVNGDVPATMLIADLIFSSPTPLTIVALGPWTNLADAFAVNPSLVPKIAGIHAMAGAIDVPGNVEVDGMTPADGVEWNVGADPDAFAAVLALDVLVTLVPLDATKDVPVPADIATRLATDHDAAGADFAYELYLRNPFLSTPGNFWWDTLAALALTAPDLVTWEDATVSVTPTGTQAGRIMRMASGRPITFASAADTDRSTEAVLAGLRRGAQRPQPFTVAGTLSVRWDGTNCTIEGPPPTSAGPALVRLTNDSAAPVALMGAGVRAPKTWADALAFIADADFSDPNQTTPDWAVPLGGGGGGFAAPGQTVTSLGTLPAAEVGVLCATGEWPDLTMVNGGSFFVGD